MKSITCGAFSAQQVRPHEWELTCKHLPDWHELIIATEPEAMDVLFALQREYRDTWAA